MTVRESQDAITIRPIRKTDESEKQAVIKLVNRCYRTTENWTNEAKIVAGQRMRASDLERDLQKCDFEIFVAEDKDTDTIIACIKTGVTTETVAGSLEEDMGYIGMFAVAPEYQSRGLGTRLSKFAEEHCRKQGVAKMALDVLGVREDIICWYERQGYQRTDQSVDADPVIRDKGEKLLIPTSFVLMVKEL